MVPGIVFRSAPPKGQGDDSSQRCKFLVRTAHGTTRVQPHSFCVDVHMADTTFLLQLNFLIPVDE